MISSPITWGDQLRFCCGDEALWKTRDLESQGDDSWDPAIDQRIKASVATPGDVNITGRVAAGLVRVSTPIKAIGVVISKIISLILTRRDKGIPSLGKSRPDTPTGSDQRTPIEQRAPRIARRSRSLLHTSYAADE